MHVLCHCHICFAVQEKQVPQNGERAGLRRLAVMPPEPNSGTGRRSVGLERAVLHSGSLELGAHE